MPADAQRENLKAWDPAAKWVRVLAERASGMVEFEFAVGDPGLFVELIMPRAQFENFCAMHGVRPTEGPLTLTCEGEEAQEFDWTLRDARAHHFRHEP